MHELVQALCPSTSTVVLERLAAHPHPAVRRAAAGTPNASVEALVSLAAEFPGDVATNPLVKLLLLEAGGDWSQLPEVLVGALPSNPVWAAELLRWARPRVAAGARADR